MGGGGGGWAAAARAPAEAAGVDMGPGEAGEGRGRAVGRWWVQDVSCPVGDANPLPSPTVVVMLLQRVMCAPAFQQVHPPAFTVASGVETHRGVSGGCSCCSVAAVGRRGANPLDSRPLLSGKNLHLRGGGGSEAKNRFGDVKPVAPTLGLFKKSHYFHEVKFLMCVCWGGVERGMRGSAGVCQHAKFPPGRGTTPAP